MTIITTDVCATCADFNEETCFCAIYGETMHPENEACVDYTDEEEDYK